MSYIYGAAQPSEPAESLAAQTVEKGGGDDTLVTCGSKVHICHVYMGQHNPENPQKALAAQTVAKVEAMIP